VCWAWVPPLKDDNGQDKPLHAPALRGAQHALRYVLCHVVRRVLRYVLRRFLHVPVLQVSPKGSVGGGTTTRTFTLPSFAAPSTSFATSFTKSFEFDVQNLVADIQTKVAGYRKRPPPYTHMPYPLFEVIPPGAAPGPPVFVASGGVKK